MQIKDEQPGDHGRIACIQYAAFKGHPQHVPGAEPTEHLIVDCLRMAYALSLSLLALAGGKAVGHIAFSPAEVGEAKTGWYLLGPVGVLPAEQGRGVGSTLVRAGLQRLRNSGASGVVLVGDPGFYGRFGFTSVPGLEYEGVPGQYVLALCFGGDRPQGGIMAHAAFRVMSSE